MKLNRKLLFAVIVCVGCVGPEVVDLSALQVGQILAMTGPNPSPIQVVEAIQTIFGVGADRVELLRDESGNVSDIIAEFPAEYKAVAETGGGSLLSGIMKDPTLPGIILASIGTLGVGGVYLLRRKNLRKGADNVTKPA